MSKNVLIISSSLRSGSNSEALAHEVEKGAKDAGNEVEFISLKGKDIRFCRGCLACQQTLKCVIKDDMSEMIKKVQNADILVFVTPIYYYEMSGQLKTFLDRCNPLYSQENKFKEVYLVTSSADGSEHASDIAVNGLQGWISCFEQAEFAGLLAGGGLEAPNDASANEEFLNKAYNFGLSLGKRAG